VAGNRAVVYQGEFDAGVPKKFVLDPHGLLGVA
jgi:hypothetical protein